MLVSASHTCIMADIAVQWCGLYENVSLRHKCLNMCFTLGDTIWIGLGDVALLEKCYWGQVLRLQSHPPFTVALCLFLVV